MIFFFIAFQNKERCGVRFSTPILSRSFAKVFDAVSWQLLCSLLRVHRQATSWDVVGRLTPGLHRVFSVSHPWRQKVGGKQEEATRPLETNDRRFSGTHPGEPGIMGDVGSPQGLGWRGLCSWECVDGGGQPRRNLEADQEQTRRLCP